MVKDCVTFFISGKDFVKMSDKVLLATYKIFILNLSKPNMLDIFVFLILLCLLNIKINLKNIRLI